MKVFKEVKKAIHNAKNSTAVLAISTTWGGHRLISDDNAHSRPSPTRVWGPKTKLPSVLSQSQQGSKTASADPDAVIAEGELLGTSTKKRAEENKDEI
jgi:hypothetical protein